MSSKRKSFNDRSEQVRFNEAMMEALKTSELKNMSVEDYAKSLASMAMTKSIFSSTLRDIKLKQVEKEEARSGTRHYHAAVKRQVKKFKTDRFVPLPSGTVEIKQMRYWGCYKVKHKGKKGEIDKLCYKPWEYMNETNLTSALEVLDRNFTGVMLEREKCRKYAEARLEWFRLKDEDMDNEREVG